MTGRQRGVGLVETLIMTLLVGGALVSGTLWLQIEASSQQAREPDAILDVASRSVRAFAETQHRLPCPDTDGDGQENCGSSVSRGNLPWLALGVEAPALRARIRQLGYIADTTGFNLTANSQGAFSPRTWEGFSDHPSDNDDQRAINNVGTQNFCRALRQADDGSGAQLLTSGRPAIYPAYAIAHPGVVDADGDGRLFDQANADAGSILARSDQAQSASYDDQVRQRSHSSLFEALGCSRLMLSLDGLSLGVGAMDEVDGMSDGLLTNAAIATAFNISSLGFSIHGTVMSGITLGTSIAELSVASSVLATAIGTCVVVVGCAEIPHAAAWVAASAVAVGASGVALPLNIAAIASQAVALGLTISAAIRAGHDVSDVDIDLSQARDAIADGIAETQDERDAIDLDYLKDDRDDKKDELDQVEDAMFDESRSIIEKVNDVDGGGYLSNSELDSEIEAAKDAAEAYVKAQQTVNEAKKTVEETKDRASQSGNGGDGDAAVDDALDELNQEINKESDPDKKQDLIDARDTLSNQLSSDSGEQLGALQDEKAKIDDRVADLNQQITDRQNQNRNATDLIERRDSFESQSELIGEQILSIGGQGSVDIAEDALNDAESQRDDRKNDFDSAVSSAVYATNELDACVIPDDSSTRDCSEIDVGRAEGYGDDLKKKLIDYRDQYSRYWIARVGYDLAKDTSQVLDEKISQARTVLDDFDDPTIQQGGAGNGPSVWSGAETILNRAMEKGGTQ